MKSSNTREHTFTEDEVEEWCERSDDSNPLHVDEAAAEDGSFGQRVVPGMMLLDQLSGLLSSLGEDNEEIILYGVTAARFRDPVLFGETVKFHVSKVEESRHYTTMDFECRVEERDSLVAAGSLSIVVN